MEGTYALWVLRLHWPTNYLGNMQSVCCRVGLRFSELFDGIYNIQKNSLLASERELHGERSSNIHPREQVWRFIYGIFLAGNCPVFFIAATLLQQYGKQVTLDGTRYWLDSKTAICWIQKRGSGNNL